ncbi:MAG: alpha/beta fold hydrolase [Deltaproteobacteria bacterium]|nr:alpha/beta fold hydrolase [Deltaproteobacteria bacterium]MBN2686786.1 alpha/beta fold hydrolase [Deltaproteobacteria bacterium]
MADYVLVPGGSISTDTWNRLTNRNEYPDGEYLGGKYWKYIAAGLEKRGHRVCAPTLKDENVNNLSDHIDQVCSMILTADLKNVILVGHSYGGMVVTGVADRMPERIEMLVYLDADFPDPGQSLFDILEAAGFNPVEVVEGDPVAYTEKLFYNPENLKPLSKAYIVCTESEFRPATDLMVQQIDFDDRNWNYFELPTNHFPQATMPDELTELFLGFEKLRGFQGNETR